MSSAPITKKSSRVVAIFTTQQAGNPLTRLTEAALVAGKGIVGDRYYNNSGTFSEQLKGTPDWEVTLIESEEIDRFNQAMNRSLSPGELRRNIITKDVRLNDLVNEEFSVGSALLKGVRLCEPCAYLATFLGPEVVKGMAHRAGLRAQVITSGTVQPDSAIHRG